MNSDFPVYTTLNECHDCYKCVRRCPAKAIKVKNGSASVMPELCVSCGECVLVCPARAKKIRNDVSRVKGLVSRGKVVVSLAPSWVSCYPGISMNGMAQAMRRLGFDRVCETAAGADVVSAQTVATLRRSGPGLYLSSACPAALEFVFRFIPEIADTVIPIASPAVVHAAALKTEYGSDTSVVFIGPCAAKKREAARSCEIDAVLTFDELDKWLESEGIELKVSSSEADDKSGGMGVFYPVEGGMLKGIKKEMPELTGITLSGLSTIEHVLSGQQNAVKEQQVFVEILACVSGCVNGPGWRNGKQRGKLEDILAVTARNCSDVTVDSPNDNYEGVMPVVDLSQSREIKEEEIQLALAEIGKYSREDELNCAGCGYQTCRNFAKAMINGKAESAMCVSYMRKLAQKKANALIRYIPAGVVVVGNNLQVIECNRRFASLCGEDTEMIFDDTDGLKGADLNRILPFAQLFEAALASGNDVSRNGYHFHGRIIDIRIFTVEPHNMVGAIIEDVTEMECRREKIAEKAREVINKNVMTVQQIAKCLGEHMADTEILLRQVASGFEENER